MCAILLDIKEGDEVIAPSYTFVSTVNAFILRGAKIVFADSEINNPNIDISNLEKLITRKTKAIIVVHYAGIACEMDSVMALAKQYNLFVVEDSAQAIDSYYKHKPLGSIGHLATLSFHETKNIISGEGGMLIINDETFIERAEIIREKGTNRSQFFRGEIDKYNWIDIGSSFLPSDIIAAFLYAQLENLNHIQDRRKSIWQSYYKQLLPLKEAGKIQLPFIPEYSTCNAHLFYIICRNLQERTNLNNYLKDKNIGAIFHYLPLHKSPYYQDKHDQRTLPNCDKFSDCLLRLPFFCELGYYEQLFITDHIKLFYEQYSK